MRLHDTITHLPPEARAAALASLDATLAAWEVILDTLCRAAGAG